MARTHNEFNLGQLFDMWKNDFKQAVQATKSGFLFLLEKIYLHPVFYRNICQSQLPIPQQIALTLEQIGSNGNRASVGQFSLNLSVSWGTVIKVSQRGIRATNSLSDEMILWPSSNRWRKILDIIKTEGCIGFVNRTTIYQWPGLDGEVYWDWKKVTP